jgi:DNA-binding transcriptional ArsR family regulator
VGVSFRSHLQVTFKYTNFKIMNVREMIPSAAEAADLMRSLSHPQRLLTLCALGPDEKSVAELRDEIGGIEQVPMSQQLMRLRADGLVESRREGTSVYYRITRPEVLRVIEALQAVYCRPGREGRRGNRPRT